VRDVSFSAYAGEVLGFAGLAGAGRTETMRLIFGADRLDAGVIFVDGKRTLIHHPRNAIRSRICLLTEDRKTQGLVLQHSVRENFALPNLDRFAFGPFLDQGKEKAETARYIGDLKIRIASQEQSAATLSGGNQQKVVLAKWLARHADIVIFDEPTRGIDVGTKYEIYLLINDLAADGKAVIMVSSELPEILGMSDRIVVMHDGRIKGVITEPARATQEDILSTAIA
jgi:ABC-type sugar transport system ATPase subunit